MRRQKRFPNLWTPLSLADHISHCSVNIGGLWYPARPLGWPSLAGRLRLAFDVFRGEADAVYWPGGQ